MEGVNMNDMPNWNAFVKRVLSEKQDKPDKGDKDNPCEKLTDTKKAGKRGDFFGEIGNKQTR